jgi:toxin ParE1/3/4
MRRIVRRPKARFDMLGAFTYIADNGGDARAEQYLRRMNAAIGYLAQHPLMGRSRPEVEEGIRSFPFEAYVIFYLALEDGIDLVRVIHSALDLENAWHGDDADDLPK